MTSPTEPPVLPADLAGLAFTNRFTRELPADPDTSVRSRGVLKSSFSRVYPVRTPAPALVAHSREVAEILGLSEETCRSEAFLGVFSGNDLLEGMDPFAMCYGGHQFGNWAGQLGDGRAINLGEVRNADGEHLTLQLKGAGPTPYSRHADGFAVLRSSVREFLCSEAMHHLGVPTTRALSLITTGADVERDMFYDGNPKQEPGAVVCRVAQSFVRFGNFEILAARKDVELLRKLADFTIRNDFPKLAPPLPEIELTPEIYLEWFREVSRRTAEMVVGWMRVGFVHGVMNTDNMSILGQTIDYGPYGWLEGYDPMWTPNTTDAAGRRYCFGAQPDIAYWNLARFAGALVPLLGGTEALQEAMQVYPETFGAKWQAMVGRKLGLKHGATDADEPLARELFELLELVETDMTIFFRGLAEVPTAAEATDAELLAPLREAYYAEVGEEARARTLKWLRAWSARVREDGVPDAERRSEMNAVNPRYVLRNYLAQLAIDKAEAGDPDLVVRLLDVLRRPYDEQPGQEEFAAKRPEWARERAGCSMLSCSS